jgi:NADPH2:quinone reductase
VAVPPEADPAAAVCIVADSLTASAMLHRGPRVERGERILVHGAAGGVGSALLQLGRRCGLEMHGTASPGNHEVGSSLGAVPIDCRSEGFVARVRALTGEGADAVFDPIGGWGAVWRSSAALRKEGRLVWFGVAASARRGIRVIPESLPARLAISLLPNGRKAPMPPNPGTPIEWYRTTLGELLGMLAAGAAGEVVLLPG